MKTDLQKTIGSTKRGEFPSRGLKKGLLDNWNEEKKEVLKKLVRLRARKTFFFGRSNRCGEKREYLPRGSKNEISAGENAAPGEGQGGEETTLARGGIRGLGGSRARGAKNAMQRLYQKRLRSKKGPGSGTRQAFSEGERSKQRHGSRGGETFVALEERGIWQEVP